ncbi:hypothetical protein KP509_03G010900 [Ceratopteris richardii]|uniref:non-specific serine/threonine protein kinase n=1 Tax=Ceratopteris richardii TaxID=49495 RepID=A0A8T2V3X1_CERRI|nr:hypothetical protein KP509_03G010900 [Ceratopteris richardii]KAH7440796.1 hypothetical protein KP509_03G010900 [Ceratopteris richardii]
MHDCELCFGLLFIFIFMACPSVSLLTSKGVNFEVQALMVIKQHLDDPTNALGSWDANSVDPCSWYHVTCSVQTSLVTNLGLPNLRLSGTLPPEIGNLTNLQSLMLENNNISGQLPFEIGKLSKLVSLDLSNNHISGPLPQSLGQLKSLTYLRLNNNSFSGPFPAWLQNIHVLDYLDLSYNNISGQVSRLPATTFNVIGNPYLCGYGTLYDCPGEPPSSVPADEGQNGQGRSKTEAIAVGIGASSIVSIVLAISAFMLWRRRQNQQIFFDTELGNSEVCLGQLRRFTFRELQTATENFHSSKILGRGGFGNVYKACLSDNSVVAVKRLKDRNAAGGEAQFQTEVEMISLAVHRNLLRLIGYCVTSTERLLVYPYMPNGSVASRLKEKPVLDWPTRKRIAVGAARGLLYLHEQCDPKIIHRDVKAANILLDEEFEAVVGDFGLAKLLDHRQSHVTTTVRGTVGHIAPEYLFTGQSSDKTDVFGFGILLLELITGQRAIDFGRHSNQRGLVLLEWVKVLQQEKRLSELVDDELKLDYLAGELEEMAKIALLCTQFDPADRPKMSEVLRMLEGDGLVERWEAWQRAEADRSQSTELMPQRYYDLVEDSSLVLEAIELSGPR